MTYGGLGKDSWSRLLRGPSLPVRLFALRALSTMGAEGAEVLLRNPVHTDGQAFPWLWAVRRCGGFHPEFPGVRFLSKWDRRQHTWRVKRSLDECAEAVLHSEHPLQLLACAVRLLELHGERAIPAWLKVLKGQADERSECAAWALGSLGTVAIPELLDAHQGASVRVRGHLAMALWYLGPRARKALPTLLDDLSPQATAALLAMEGAANEALVERGRGPVWLDVKGVQALARLAYADEVKGRVFAAAGLGCYGPDCQSGLPILEHLARDPERKVRLTLAHSLSWGERRDALDIVLLLTEDPEESVRKAADQTLRTLFESVIPARQALLDRVMEGSLPVRKAAAAQLARVGLPPDRQDEVSQLIEEAPPALLPHLLEAADICGGIGFHRQPVLALIDQNRGPEARCAVVRTLAPFLDTQGFARLRELLYDEEEEVALLAARLLARKGLGRLGLGERLLSVPDKALLELLEHVQKERYPEGVQVADWLPLLGHPKDSVKALAARALERLAGTEAVSPEVVDCLLSLLDSEQGLVVLTVARTLLEYGLDQAGFAAMETLLKHPDPAISALSARLLGRRGLRGLREVWPRLPVATLLLVLEAAREADFPATEESDLLLLLRHPDPAIVRAAAEALERWAGALTSVVRPAPDGVVVAQEPRQPSPELLEGLRGLLESDDIPVRVAGARALLGLGHDEALWILLDSPSDRGWAHARLKASETLPEEFLDAFARGRCVTAEAISLLQSRLEPPECAALLAAALSHTSSAHGSALRTSLVSLGLAGLEVLPELLGHPREETRSQALRVLGQLLYTNLDVYVEWLAERGLVLPLQHPDQSLQVQLHLLLAQFLEYSKGWASLRFLPLLEVLSRSPSRRAATLTLTGLARHLSQHPDPGVLRMITEAARSHPAHEVRLAAVRHLRGLRGVGEEVAAWSPDPDAEVELQRLALVYRALELSEEQLHWALTQLRGPEEDSLLLPGKELQFVQLTRHLGDPEVGPTALRLLLGHPGKVGRAAWVQLVRTLLSTEGVVARALVGKWPRLVVSALKAPEGSTWVAQLGPAALPGLRLALSRRGYVVRLRALEAVGSNAEALAEELSRLAASDPHPAVRKALSAGE